MEMKFKNIQNLTNAPGIGYDPTHPRAVFSTKVKSKKNTFSRLLRHLQKIQGGKFSFFSILFEIRKHIRVKKIMNNKKHVIVYREKEEHARKHCTKDPRSA